MNNLVEPQSPETKQALENLGLKPWAPETYPNYANPDKMEYHLTNAVVLGLSFAGRWYAGKLGVTRMPFTASIVSMFIQQFYDFQWSPLFTCSLFSRKRRDSSMMQVKEEVFNKILNFTLSQEEHGTELLVNQFIYLTSILAIRNAEVAELKQKSQ
eukprot:403349367